MASRMHHAVKSTFLVWINLWHIANSLQSSFSLHAWVVSDIRVSKKLLMLFQTFDSSVVVSLANIFLACNSFCWMTVASLKFAWLLYAMQEVLKTKLQWLQLPVSCYIIICLLGVYLVRPCALYKLQYQPQASQFPLPWVLAVCIRCL